MTRQMLAAAAVAVTVAGIVAAGAAAQPTPTTSAYLCYSKFQVDPGSWLLTTPGSNHHSAADLLALGYWSPYAENSVPTQTAIGGGYYLICNLPANLSPTGNAMITRKGDAVSPVKFTGVPGYYPLAT